MTKTKRLFAVLCSLLLATLACAHTITPIKTPGIPTGQITRTLTHTGLQRSYILYAPASVKWNQAVPLVFVFHGGTGNAESAMRMSGFNQVADKDGFIVVYPNGTGRLSDDKLLTWNGGNCCAYAQEKMWMTLVLCAPS